MLWSQRQVTIVAESGPLDDINLRLDRVEQDVRTHEETLKSMDRSIRRVERDIIIIQKDIESIRSSGKYSKDNIDKLQASMANLSSTMSTFRIFMEVQKSQLGPVWRVLESVQKWAIPLLLAYIIFGKLPT